MKENKYDDDVFFNKYKEMNRSVQGLEGAGEWSQLKQLLPNFEGKRVLSGQSSYLTLSMPMCSRTVVLRQIWAYIYLFYSQAILYWG